MAPSDDQVSDHARSVALEVITARRDKAVAKQHELASQRAELLEQTRRNDRELADCRAAARIFGLNIEIPDELGDDNRAYLMRREREAMERARAIETHSLPQRIVQRVLARNPDASEAPKPALPTAAPPIYATGNLIASALNAATGTARKQRPALRDVLLEQLKSLRESGSKAAPLRDYFERTYGEVIHEKTVGMTLYRLSKERLVRRDGHTWFFVDPGQSGETKNPGGETPGPRDLLG